MPVVALSFLAVYAALGFGWRSWLQRRHTGSMGFNGISGGTGSVEWLAGVGFAVAVAGIILAPTLQLLDVLTPVPVVLSMWIQTLGVVSALFGIAGTLYAQLGMGDSWRIGVDNTETTTLVDTGAFAVARNPVFTAMLVFAFGITLMTPNVLAFIGFALLFASIELQVRAVEEPYLEAVHGDAYRDYASTVGRFVPRAGRRRTAPPRAEGPGPGRRRRRPRRRRPRPRRRR